MAQQEWFGYGNFKAGNIVFENVYTEIEPIQEFFIDEEKDNGERLSRRKGFRMNVKAEFPLLDSTDLANFGSLLNLINSDEEFTIYPRYLGSLNDYQISVKAKDFNIKELGKNYIGQIITINFIQQNLSFALPIKFGSLTIQHLTTQADDVITDQQGNRIAI